MSLPRERTPYSAIVDRPPLPPLPDGNRIVFWTIVNVEVWDITRPMPRVLLVPPQGQVRFPDVANWAWHEYGNRVGIWRFGAVRAARHPAHLVHQRARLHRLSADCRRCDESRLGDDGPQLRAVADARRDRSRVDDRADARHAREAHRAAPIGWLSPGFGETFDTPDHLAAAGLKYIAEWPYNDEPTRISTKHGPLVTLPYPIECQDVTTLAVQTQEAQYFARKCIDAFERLYEESARGRSSSR